jgi:hypothetical protein
MLTQNTEEVLVQEKANVHQITCDVCGCSELKIEKWRRTIIK